MPQSMKRVMIFVSETDTVHGKNLGMLILEKLKHEGFAGGSIFKGIAGFGKHGQVHTAGILDLNVALPNVIIFIDSEEKVRNFIPQLEGLITEGAIVIDDVEVIELTKK